MNIFESHAHYDDSQFDIDREELIEKIKNEGIKKIISAGYSKKGSIDTVKLSEKYEFIYSTVGISPNDIGENYIEDIKEIEKLLESNNKKIVAVGEIGLDYHYDTDKKMQKEAFIKQIELANKYNFPIVIHTRDAVMDTIQILKENPVNKKGVFHCCPFNRELVKEALKLGYYISFSGTVTFKNSKNAEEIVKMVPEDRFLVETDSPYLAPEPNRGKRNDSRNLKFIIKKIAEFKEKTEEEIAKLSYNNAVNIFNIKE